jgi:hypothetical protein
MADNVNITAGAGTVVATDQCGTDHYQRIKLTDGTADSTTPINVDIGVKANALRIAPANDITDGTYIGDIKFGEALATVTTVSTVTNLAQMGGAAIAMNEGVLAAGVQRVTLATNDDAVAHLATIAGDTTNIETAIQILDDWDDANYCNVNLNVAGTDVAAGEGTISAQTQRVTIATDDDGVAYLATIAGDTTSIDGKITACNTGAVVLAASDGTDIGNVDVASIVPGTGATNLGKAEDAGHASGDVGVMVLSVRDDAPSAAKAAEGDYTPLLTNATGHLYAIDPTANALATTTNSSLGATDAALVDAGAVGSISSKLRRLTTDTGVIAGDTTSIDGKITACNTGAVVLSSGTVTTVSTVTNLSQLGGTAISMNEGTLDAGCQRVTLATDDDGVAHLATIAGDTTNIETAIQIIDDWDATHDSAASADGPQMMAAYDSTKPTAIGDGDAVRVLADSYGRLLHGVEPQRFQAVFDSADATGEGEVVKASAASTVIVVQSYVISSDVEGWIKLQDEASTALTGKFWLKAGGGVAITLPENAPIVLGTDKDLEVICEAAGNVSVSVTGYTIPG